MCGTFYKLQKTEQWERGERWLREIQPMSERQLEAVWSFGGVDWGEGDGRKLSRPLSEIVWQTSCGVEVGWVSK